MRAHVHVHVHAHMHVQVHVHVHVSADVSAKTVQPQVVHVSPHPYHLSAEPLGVAGFCKICIAETLSACALEADLITAYGNLFILRPSCQLHRPSSEP